MNENEWVKLVIKTLENKLGGENIQIHQGKKLPYAYEIQAFQDDKSIIDTLNYETDILITEHNNEKWKPRLVIECKINSVTTHDAITYSQKAYSHKNIFPYLRYGILIGNRKYYPLLGRLYRHGAYFDFMQSWVNYESQGSETGDLLKIIEEEIKASHQLEEILYNSRKKGRKKFTLLHKPLVLR